MQWTVDAAISSGPHDQASGPDPAAAQHSTALHSARPTPLRWWCCCATGLRIDQARREGDYKGPQPGINPNRTAKSRDGLRVARVGECHVMGCSRPRPTSVGLYCDRRLCEAAFLSEQAGSGHECLIAIVAATCHGAVTSACERTYREHH